MAKAFTTAGLVFFSLLTILLCLISLDLGVLAAGILALCIFYVVEGRRHKNWENTLEHTLKSLRQSRAQTEERLQQHGQDIALIKTQLAGLRAVRGKERTGESALPSDGEIIPALLRPQVPNTPSKHAAVAPAANDEKQMDDEAVSDLVVRELLRTAVEKHKIDAFMQPVVRLPQRQVKFYEMFARIRARPGVYLPAARYMEIAAQESLMIPIDRLLLLQSLQIIKKSADKRRTAGFFINIEPAILKNAEFMQRVVQFVAQNRDLAPALIFEIRQSAYAKLSPGEKKILGALAKLGCRMSLDHVRDIPENVESLQKDNIRFIKLRADHMLEESATDKRFSEMMRRKRVLEANGIGVIVEKIESEKDLVEILDYNIHYGQGYLFGRPSLRSAA